MELARFGDAVFGVAESGAMLFEKLKISAGCETESQESGGQGFVTRKKGSPMEVTLTAILHSGLGLDVQKKAMELFDMAKDGKADYFYLGTEKLWPYKLLLKSAASEEITLSPGGKWVQARISLGLSQGESGVQEAAPSAASAGTASAGSGGGQASGGTGTGSKIVKGTKKTAPAQKAHGDNYMIQLTGSVAKKAKQLPALTGGGGKSTANRVTFGRN